MQNQPPTISVDTLIDHILDWSWPYEGVFKDGILATVNYLRSINVQEISNPKN